MDTIKAKELEKSCQNIQESIFQNKIDKGFNITDVPFEFGLTLTELGEAFDAWRKQQDGLGEELADVAIFLFGLAAILKIDLGKEIVSKIEKNKNREYRKIKGVVKEANPDLNKKRKRAAAKPP